MEWLDLMTLTDGTRVQSAMPSDDEAEDSSGPWYRLHGPTGDMTEFHTMSSMLVHLYDCFRP